MNILVTGISGSGKSTLLPELQKHGFKTYNTDDIPGVYQLENKQTGEPLDWPDGYVDWTVYAYRWQAEPLRTLLDSSENVAVAAVMENQQKFYEWFDLRFVITIENDALRRHWRESSGHHRDAHPDNLERALLRNKVKEQEFIDEGCIPIAGDRPLGEMAADVMRIIHEHTNVA